MTEQSTSTVAITATPAPTMVVSNSTKSLKRKLEDAIQILDEAVVPTMPPSSAPNRTLPKRLRTARSIYGMLTKYSNKETTQTPAADLSKTAPQLAKILTRAASRTAKALPLTLGHSYKSHDASPSDYRPSSSPQFFQRLATFKMSTYSNKPAPIDAVAAARCGWINTDKDRLLCKVCGASWVLAGRDGMPRDAANALVEKQHTQLVDAHRDGCPWKTRQCDESINSIFLKTPPATVRELKKRALLLDASLEGVKIAHPLSNLQVQSLVSIVSSVTLPNAAEESDSEASIVGEPSSPLPQVLKEPSQTAILAALFGWDVAPPTSDSRKPTPSASRAGSAAPRGMSRPPISRASSVSRASTPTPSASPFRPSVSTSLLSRHAAATNGKTSPADTILHCPLCHRRLGLWAYLPKPESQDDPMTGDAAPQPKKQQPTLNILQEHRPYCAYTVRTSVIPTMPQGHQRSASMPPPGAANGASVVATPANGKMEGWRAVFSVVMRYGAVQRQRLGLSRVQSAQVTGTEGAPVADEEVDMETNSIEAMVDGVKKRGGRDLLQYVKGLLA